MNSINKEKIERALQNFGNIQFAYLVGSLAKNKARFGSDFDIVVYFGDWEIVFFLTFY